MIIRSFTDESVAAALKLVRSQMGGEAVVLKTRRLENTSGKVTYEVTACLDSDSVGQTSQALETSTNQVSVSSHVSRLGAETFSGHDSLELRLRSLEAKLDGLNCSNALDLEGLEKYRDIVLDFSSTLIEADVPGEWLRSLLDQVRQKAESTEVDVEFLRSTMIDLVQADTAEPPDFKAGDRVLVIGPAGSGKTSVIGKLLAAQLKTHKLPVTLKALDPHKVGAIDEIESYRDLLGLSHEVDEPQKKCLTMIDSGPIPHDDKTRSEFIKRIQHLKPTYTFLVIPAVMRTSDVIEFLSNTNDLKVGGIIGTMLDLTHRLGGLLAACRTCDTKQVYVSDSPSGQGDLQSPDAARLVQSILKCGASHE